MELYNSVVKVIEVSTIPENGDEIFSLGNPNYHKIVAYNEVDIDYSNMGDLSHTPSPKAGIGVLQDGTTLLVEVSEPGVTVKQLANIFTELQAAFAVYTGAVGIIADYEQLQALAQPVEPDVVDEPTEEKQIKSKKK